MPIAKGRQIPRQREHRFVETLGMEHSELLRMRKRWLATVDRLKQQKVGDLADAGMPRLRKHCRKRIAALLQ